MANDHQPDNQQGHGEKRSHRSPQPGPERKRQKHRQWIEREPPPEDRRRDEVAFERGQRHEGGHRQERVAERRKGDEADPNSATAMQAGPI